MLSTLHHINIMYLVRNLPVRLQEPLGVLGQLSFGRSHLVLLRQQLVLQLQQLVLTLLNCRQQLLLVLWGNDVIERKNKENSPSDHLTRSLAPQLTEGLGRIPSSARPRFSPLLRSFPPFCGASSSAVPVGFVRNPAVLSDGRTDSQTPV